MEKIYEVVRIKQVVLETDKVDYFVRSPEDAVKVAYDFIGDDDREVFLVLCLNTKNKVNAVHRCHVGSINSAIIHPREIFKSAILNNSASIIVAHNHPSGDPTPSMEDVHVTKQLVEAGKIIGIEVLDHLVIAGGDREKYVSLKEKGYV